MFFNSPRLNQSENHTQPEEKIDFLPEQCLYIEQRRYAITNHKEDKRILASDRAFACIILALFDKVNKIAVLTHVDAYSNLSPLVDVYEKLSKDNTVAFIVGGNDDDAVTYCKVKKFIEINKINVVFKDTGRYKMNNRASLAIDAENGKIYYPTDPDQIAKPTIRPNVLSGYEQAVILADNSPMKEIIVPKKNRM